jgi:hypothetical protein
MKHPSLLLKIAAVGSALFLSTGLIAYRTGAFHPSGTHSSAASTDPTFMNGSKSYHFGGTEQGSSPATPSAPTLMSGSKFASGNFAPPSVTDTAPAKPTNSSSKPTS